MSRKRKSRVRRLRRKSKAVMKHGKKAGPRHTAKTGRTGKIRSSRLRSGVSTHPAHYQNTYVYIPGHGMVRKEITVRFFPISAKEAQKAIMEQNFE